MSASEDEYLPSVVLFWDDNGKRAKARPLTPDPDCPYCCQECGDRLVDLNGTWQCFCRWGGVPPTAEEIIAHVDKTILN